MGYNIFSATPLGIFTKEDIKATKLEVTPTLFDVIETEELHKSVRFPPRNSFEEMWQFPIDNEQDIGDEANIPFHKHIFLEQHLKKFDSSGPVRHFMELVINGLSKNPYMPLNEKVEHIDWYVLYFKDKKVYLDEFNKEI